eukprot:scaffold232611_cov19-Tisochrysis_lutea.AAC.1
MPSWTSWVGAPLGHTSPSTPHRQHTATAGATAAARPAPTAPQPSPISPTAAGKQPPTGKGRLPGGASTPLHPLACASTAHSIQRALHLAELHMGALLRTAATERARVEMSSAPSTPRQPTPPTHATRQAAVHPHAAGAKGQGATSDGGPACRGLLPVSPRTLRARTPAGMAIAGGSAGLSPQHAGAGGTSRRAGGGG